MLRRILEFFRPSSAVTAAPAAPMARPAAMPSWQSLRVPETQWDRSLQTGAQAWLALLPVELRPHALCAAYPRIANRLALIWADRPAIKAYFDDLLVDRRGGRVGFAAEIRDELTLLRSHHEKTMGDPQAARDWKERLKAASTQAPADAGKLPSV